MGIYLNREKIYRKNGISLTSNSQNLVPESFEIAIKFFGKERGKAKMRSLKFEGIL